MDWASDVSHEEVIDDTVVDLAAITLAWMFTTPNRFLRDRATKALVALLSGRLGIHNTVGGTLCRRR